MVDFTENVQTPPPSEAANRTTAVLVNNVHHQPTPSKHDWLGRGNVDAGYIFCHPDHVRK